MNKKLFLFFIIFGFQSVYACCGCAIVNASMSALSSTASISLQTYDSTVSSYYKSNITQNIKDTLNNLENRLKMLNNQINIEALSSNCSEEEIHELKKTIKLLQIDKSLDIYKKINEN